MLLHSLRFEKLSPHHRAEVIDIYNYYVLNDTSAFNASVLSDGDYDLFMQRSKTAYAILLNDKTIGFCTLGNFLGFSAFDKTATLSLYIDPVYTAMGYGSIALDKLECDARRLGINSLVSIVSSENDASLNFHLKNGFDERGYLDGVGEKFGKSFGLVYMQKML